MRGSHGFATAVWASPAIFLVHDLEEWFMLPRWLANGAAGLPGPVLDRIPGHDAYAVAFGLLFGLHLAASWGFARRPRRTSSALFFAVVVAARLWNVPWHTAQALLVGGYVPGLATAWLVVAPFAAWLLGDVCRRGWVARGRIAVVAASALVLHFAAIATSLAAGLITASLW